MPFRRALGDLSRGGQLLCSFSHFDRTPHPKVAQNTKTPLKIAETAYPTRGGKRWNDASLWSITPDQESAQKAPPTPRTRVQFRQCAILQYSKTPSLRSPGFEDEDEAPHETGEAGIRTLGTLLGYNALAKRRFRPLSHLTKKESAEYSGRCRTSN
jgi:hypothetical protein